MIHFMLCNHILITMRRIGDEHTTVQVAYGHLRPFGKLLLTRNRFLEEPQSEHAGEDETKYAKRANYRQWYRSTPKKSHEENAVKQIRCKTEYEYRTPQFRASRRDLRQENQSKPQPHHRNAGMKKLNCTCTKGTIEFKVCIGTV